MVSKGVRPLAQRFITSMKYAERITMTTAFAGLPVVYMFNLNSLQDPNRTGIGHQPFGHDTLSPLYQRYRVYAVSYSVIVEPTTSSPGMVTVIPKNDDGGVGPDAGFVMEFPRGKTAPLGFQTPTVITGRISLPALTGQTLTEYKGSDRYAAVFGNSPTEIMTLQTYLTTQVATTVVVNVSLTYECELFDPIGITIS